MVLGSLLGHLAEGGVGGKQLIVGTRCYDVPLLHEVDDIAVLDRREAVGDHDDGSVLRGALDRVHHLGLGDTIE